MNERTATRGIPPTLEAQFAAIPAARQRVVRALLTPDGRGLPPTYASVAARLGLSRGSVAQHLRHLRQQTPELYSAVMIQRGDQLLRRHQAAVAALRARVQRWHRRAAERRVFMARVLGNAMPWEVTADGR